MVWEEKMPISEISEFSILPYTQNRKLGNLGKFSFASNFDSSCNLRCKNNKKISETKSLKSSYASLKKGKFPRFSSIQFCPIPKIENSEISQSVLSLRSLAVVVT